MNEVAISGYITATFADVLVASAEGAVSFSYNPARVPSAGVFFATLKSKNDPYDDVSALDRPGVFRLNLGLTEAAYRALFGALPSRPTADDVIETTHDFTRLDVLLPHPVYAYLGWVCVLSPSDATFETVKPLLADAYALAVSRYQSAG